MAICRPCIGLTPCIDPSDLATGIDGALYSSLDFSFVVQCPPQCFCPSGLFPQTISILASTIPPVIPPINEPGAPIILRLQGCTSLITRTLSAGSSQSEIAAAAQSMQAEWAGQQALCNALLIPGVNCNTGRTIDVCNDAQTFVCYNGQQFTTAAGTFCKNNVSVDGLTQTQIDALIASIKVNLNSMAKDQFCPAHEVVCTAAYVPVVILGFSTINLRFINVSNHSIDLSPWVLCLIGGITECIGVGQPFPPSATSVGPNTFADFGGGSSPTPITADVYWNGVKTLAGITTPVPISQGFRIEITLGCGG